MQDVKWDLREIQKVLERRMSRKLHRTKFKTKQPTKSRNEQRVKRTQSQKKTLRRKRNLYKWVSIIQSRPRWWIRSNRAKQLKVSPKTYSHGSQQPSNISHSTWSRIRFMNRPDLIGLLREATNDLQELLVCLKMYCKMKVWVVW